MSREATYGSLCVLGAAVLWGTTGTAAAMAPGVGSLAVGAAAMGVGGLLQAACALGVMRAHRVGLAAQWRTLAVAAVAVAVYPLAFYTSMRLAGVAIGTVVSIGSAPMSAALIERAIDGRPLSRRWALGAAVGVLGVLALAFAHPAEETAASTSGSEPVLGIALGLLAGVTYALYSWAAARTMGRGLPSRPVMGAVFGAGGVLLLPVLLLTGGPIVAAWPNFAAVAYLALVPMFLGYVLFGRGLAAVPASTATSLSLLEPAVAAVIAVIVLHERLPALGWSGLGIVLASLLITVAPRRPGTDTGTSPSTSPSRAVGVVPWTAPWASPARESLSGRPGVVPSVEGVALARHVTGATRSAGQTDRVDDHLRALRDSCTHALAGHGPARAADLLATVPTGTEVDRYGEGGVVAELEAEVAGLLGQPAAVHLPSGTMAQQAVLRVHAGRTGRRTVLFHPECHLDRHEGRALERLHDLTGRPVGDRHRLLTLDDLAAVAEPPAALVLELPQRDLGGRLPDWDDLVAQTDWARDRGAAVHLDGARLWEASAGYGRPPAELAALFDTTYVSFYKGLGALAGCCLAGPEDVVAEVREWRGRMGGTLFGLWPGAASALTCLRRRLPLMPGYLARARAIAADVRDLPGVTVVPDPPQTPMLHLLLRTTPDAFAAAARSLAAERSLWTWEKAMTTGDPAVQRVELPVGDATMALTTDQVRDAVALLVGATPVR